MSNKALTVGELFAGIGGFGLAAERAGLRVAWQSEIDPYASAVLKKHWPDVPNHGDIREMVTRDDIPAVDIIAGGDPCPSRSRARAHRKSQHPDLAGYFLAVVGRLRPRWVVRENVFAPDACDFGACLELLGYGVIPLGFDARDFTAQSRRRQFIIGSPAERAAEFTGSVLDAADGLGFSTSSGDETTPIAACVTAHPNRMAAEDSYVFEPGRGLRILATEERERLQGFSGSWTDGFSRSARTRMIGNAVCVPVATWIFQRILDHERSIAS